MQMARKKSGADTDHLGRGGLSLGRASRFVTISGGNAVERINGCAFRARRGSWGKVESDILPGVAAFGAATERGGGFVAAVHHAVFATLVARDAVDDAVFLPFGLLEQFAIARIVPVGHQVARGFPAADIAGRDRPGRAGQLAFSGQKIEVDRRAEERVSLRPTPGCS